MSIVLKVGAVACGLIAVGCVSKMSALNSEESSNVVGNIEGKYVLEKVNARGSGIDATRLREALLADQMLQTMLGGPVDDKQSLPVYVSVSATKKDANGGIATVNNVFAVCTLYRRVLSNRNMVDYATVQSDECPNRTARPERPFPDGPAAVRLFGVQGLTLRDSSAHRRVSSKGSTVV